MSTIQQRVEEFRNRLRTVVVESYNEADGDIESARLLLRKKRIAYGFDIATAMLLFQLALMLYKWAKENGYLTEISVVAQEGEPTIEIPMEMFADD
jgi:hypothetical protein